MLAEKYPWSPPSKDNAPGLAKTTDEEMPSQSSPRGNLQKPQRYRKYNVSCINTPKGILKPENQKEKKYSNVINESKNDEKAQEKSSDSGDEKSEAGEKTAEKKNNSEHNNEEK